MSFYDNLGKGQSVILLVVKGSVIVALVAIIAQIWFF